MRERYRPGVHCITNPVTMQGVANILLAAGGRAIMAQAPEEVEEITALCQALLLNTGVPSKEKIRSCVLAGKKANILGIPVVLDPVGAGASRFRAEQLELLTKKVRFSIIRCNQEEAKALLHIWEGRSGGVESGVDVEEQEQLALAERLALDYGCTAFVSGKRDAVSDGKESRILEGGSRWLARLTGGGCMLSALCALMCGLGMTPYEAALTAGRLWRESAALAERQTEAAGAGIGTFQAKLFDAVEELFYRGEKE